SRTGSPPPADDASARPARRDPGRAGRGRGLPGRQPVGSGGRVPAGPRLGAGEQPRRRDVRLAVGRASAGERGRRRRPDPLGASNRRSTGGRLAGMGLDYGRLIDGLNASATMINAGGAGLPVVHVLITAVQDATGAVGATFTQYDREGGRCVAATGDLMWALGQPISAEFIEPAVPARAWIGRTGELRVQIAEPLAGRGLLAMAGHPVQSGSRVLGAVHVYFADT